MFNKIREALINAKELHDDNPAINLSVAAIKSSSFNWVKPSDFSHGKKVQQSKLSTTKAGLPAKNNRKQNDLFPKVGRKPKNDTCQYCGKVRGYKHL